MEEIRLLKMAAMKNLKPIFDEYIAKSIPAMIIDSSDGMIMHSTPLMNQRFGYENEELDMMNISCLIPKKFRGNTADHFNYLQDKSVDLLGEKKSGDEIKIKIDLKPVEIIGKKFFVGIILDK